MSKRECPTVFLTAIVICTILSSVGLTSIANGQEVDAQKQAAVQILLQALQDADSKVEALANRALRSDDIEPEIIAPLVEELLHSDDEIVRVKAIWVFSVQDHNWPIETSVGIITRMFENDDEGVVKAAFALVKPRHMKELTQRILKIVKDEDSGKMLQFAGILTLASHADTLELALPHIEKKFKHWDTSQQIELLAKLNGLGIAAGPSIEFVAVQMKSDNAEVRQECARVARNLLDLRGDSTTGRNVRSSRVLARESNEARMLAYVDSVMNKYDKDQDGVISEDELERMSGSIRRRIKQGSREGQKTWTRDDIQKVVTGA